MSFDATPPDRGEIDRLFLQTPPVKPGDFELALVMGGTVSAGAWTAGAVDFLFEALDCFETAKASGGAPRHDVILKVVAGTSGGGVNAAIAARALAYDWPHVVRATPMPMLPAAINPFYEIWINRLTLPRFLDPSDIAGTIPSVLNGAPIDDAAQWIEAYEANARSAPRAWIAAPLTVILTVTNLCGIPSRVSFGAGQFEDFIDHADHARFAVYYPGQSTDRSPRPDEFALGFGSARLPQMVGWSDFSQFARATSAFPVGFPTRQLTRPLAQYKYRVVAVPPGPGEQTSYRVVSPDWSKMVGGADPIPETYHFSAVDGGATDNEPVELARTALAGLLGRNPRDADEANRAVLLVDPFAGRTPVTPAGVSGAVKTATATLTALLQQTRYSTSDLLLAADEEVFSRFMLTPVRDGLTGGEALAANGLGAFIGFASDAFMRHDYLLGRYNCQKFLREEFRLARANPLFHAWSDGDKDKHAVDGMLPIVPLFGDADIAETKEAWPKGRLDPESYRDAIEERFRAIFEVETEGIIGGAVARWIGAHLTQKEAADYVITAMKNYLVAAKLS